MLNDLDLLQVAKAAGINLKQGTNTCPFCGERTFYISGNRFRCYRPRCGHHGGIPELLKGLRLVDPDDSIWPWLKAHKICDPSQWWQRVTTLERVFRALQHYRFAAKDYLVQRHLHQFAASDDYGYQPPDVSLKTIFSSADLLAAGLIDDNGRELMQGRVVFPIRSVDQHIVHVIGRSLDPDNTLRWCSTTRKNSTSINRYFYNEDKLPNHCSTNGVVFLCEGITDALSLQELGFFTLGSIGLEADLRRLYAYLAECHALIAIYDSDMMVVNNIPTYKSWPRVLTHLVQLATAQPDCSLVIGCLKPPVNDLNDWLRSGLTSADFLTYCESHLYTLPTAIDLLDAHHRSNHLARLVHVPQYRSEAKQKILNDVDRFLDNLHIL